MSRSHPWALSTSTGPTAEAAPPTVPAVPITVERNTGTLSVAAFLEARGDVVITAHQTPLCRWCGTVGAKSRDGGAGY
jgi:hypothetical protein